MRAGPISLADMGSFHIGGREIEFRGLPLQVHQYSAGGVPAEVDPNGHYPIEQMYVQYFIAGQPRGQVPLMLWHGGGMTGVNYEKTPDGRDGWLNGFLRLGWSVYNSDAVERGRSGWPALPQSPWPTEPIAMAIEHAAVRFRLDGGTAPGARQPDTQFPLDHLGQFGKQLSPRWTSTDVPTLRAYVQLLERAGPCIVVAHSQGGGFAIQAARAAPDKVRALVLVEPANAEVDAGAAAMHGIPILMIYGDGIERDPRWPAIRRKGVDFAQAVADAGGSAEVLDLPAVGHFGNTHMLMMDRNNMEVAALINGWLAAKGLYS
jgi:pimeloyl-ACP methyl ester carboxylesterase